jgi:hypothetical protein
MGSPVRELLRTGESPVTRSVATSIKGHGKTTIVLEAKEIQ